MGSIDYTPFILIAALGIGGYFLYQAITGGGLSNLFSGAGAKASAANQASIQATNASATAATQAQVTASGQQPTLTPSQLASNANSIFNDGIQGNPVPDSDQESIRDTVIECNNTADWIGLVAAFGSRNVTDSNGNTHADDLATFLRGTLDSDYVESINDYFSNTQINAQL